MSEPPLLALRLVLAQKLLKNQKMRPFEALVYVSPMCLLFMLPVALFKELPAAHAAGSFQVSSYTIYYTILFR